jgi:hypothetical protein
MRYLHFFDASHLFIGLAGFALTVESFVVNHYEIYYPVCFLVGCATIVFYGVHRLIQIEKYKSVPSQRITMLSHFRPIVLIFSLLALTSCVALVWIYFMNYWLIWLSLGIAALFYLIPWIQGELRIRDLPYLKIWVIAAAWAFVTVMLPYYLRGLDGINPTFLIIERFLFFLLITLPFDIRDRIEDDRLNLRTFATYLTRPRFNQFGVVIFILLTAFIWFSPFELFYTISLQILAIGAFISLLQARDNSPLWYFSFVIDGLIIGRLLIYLLFVSIVCG